jgi:hypothetical protein
MWQLRQFELSHFKLLIQFESIQSVNVYNTLVGNGLRRIELTARRTQAVDKTQDSCLVEAQIKLKHPVIERLNNLY